jgi:hypothetical protein
MQPINIISKLNAVVGANPTISPAGLSGYCLTDQHDGIDLKRVSGTVCCDSETVLEIERARDDASRNFLTDFSVEFAKIYRSEYADYSGGIGKLDPSTAIVNDKTMAIVEVRSWGLDSVMAIRSLTMYSNVTAAVTVSVHSENNITTPIGSVVINCLAGQFVTADLSPALFIELAAVKYQSLDNRPRFYLSWTIPTGGYARYNTVSCCGASKDYLNFIEVAGFSANSLSEMAAGTAINNGRVTMGVSINSSIACTFHNLFDSLDYTIFNASGFQWALAKTLQHGGVMNLADRFIKSQNINQYTLLSREVVYGIRSHAESEYKNGVKWLANNVPGGALGCFKCNETLYRVSQILV